MNPSIPLDFTEVVFRALYPECGLVIVGSTYVVYPQPVPGRPLLYISDSLGSIARQISEGENPDVELADLTATPPIRSRSARSNTGQVPSTIEPGPSARNSLGSIGFRQVRASPEMVEGDEASEDPRRRASSNSRRASRSSIELTTKSDGPPADTKLRDHLSDLMGATMTTQAYLPDPVIPKPGSSKSGTYSPPKWQTAR